MPLVNDSQDLLYLIISLAILALTFFVCWAIYYLAMILRQSFRVIKEMRNRLHQLDEVLALLKEKIESSASYLLLIGEGVKKLVEIIRERTEKKKTHGRRTKKEE